MSKVSIRPSDMVEGGAVPFNRNLVWEECRWNIFDYTTKEGKVVATAVALRVKYKDDDGGEYEQQYSAGDPERFIVADDGKSIDAVAEGGAVSKSSNFHLLMSSLVSSGFPEDRLGDDVSVLDGLYTYNVALPEPDRPGLKREKKEGERERSISVPTQVLKLPWEKKGAAKGKPAAKPAAAPAAEADSEEVMAQAVAAAVEMLAEEGTDKVTRQQVATKAMRDKNQPVANAMFKSWGDVQIAMMAAGLSVDGDEITQG